MKRMVALIVLFSTLTLNTKANAFCQQGEFGGQCVSYVRTEFGGSFTLMPGLCQYDSDCGARHAWGSWDLGFGDGQIPADNSIMILDGWPERPTGHMGILRKASKNLDETYTLIVDEANWCINDCELMFCRILYTFYPNEFEVIRENGTDRYPVLGFIYSYYLTYPALSQNLRIE